MQQYRGHHPEHAGLQSHSVGPIYPFIIVRHGGAARDTFTALNGRTGTELGLGLGWDYDTAHTFARVALRQAGAQ